VNIHCLADLASKMPRILQNISQTTGFSVSFSLETNKTKLLIFLTHKLPRLLWQCCFGKAASGLLITVFEGGDIFF
jgi:hypothetical protein